MDGFLCVWVCACEIERFNQALNWVRIEEEKILIGRHGQFPRSAGFVLVVDNIDEDEDNRT